MNRFRFLQSLFTLSAVSGGWTVLGAPPERSSSFSAAVNTDLPDRSEPEKWISSLSKPHWPPFLKKGDLIGIPAASGFMMKEGTISAQQFLEGRGYRVSLGSNIGKRWGNMGGKDEERLASFQQMLDDPAVKGILLARGGYGLVRIIDRLDFSQFRLHPKWIVGFSDATVLQLHLQARYQLPSIHAKMVNSFPAQFDQAPPDVQASILSTLNLLEGKKEELSFPESPYQQVGEAVGELVGGNLSVLYGLLGTRSMPSLKGKILFLEDAGEYLYHYDRMFWALKRNGCFEDIAGLVLGGFRHKPSEDKADEFPLSVPEMVVEKMGNPKIPVAFGLPVGHQLNNRALRIGGRYKLEVKHQETGILREIT